jgi:hypothetical protein
MGGKFKTSPFLQHSPNSLLRSVQTLLAGPRTICNIMHRAKGKLQALLSDLSNSTRREPPRNQEMASRFVEQGWGVGPGHDWLQGPLVSRPSVGRDLLDRATFLILCCLGTVRTSAALTWPIHRWISQCRLTISRGIPNGRGGQVSHARELFLETEKFDKSTNCSRTRTEEEFIER